MFPTWIQSLLRDPASRNPATSCSTDEDKAEERGEVTCSRLVVPFRPGLDPQRGHSLDAGREEVVLGEDKDAVIQSTSQTQRLTEPGLAGQESVIWAQSGKAAWGGGI